HAREGALVGGEFSVPRDHPVAGGEDEQIDHRPGRPVGKRRLSQSPDATHQPEVLLPRVHLLGGGEQGSQLHLTRGDVPAATPEVPQGQGPVVGSGLLARAGGEDQDAHDAPALLGFPRPGYCVPHSTRAKAPWSWMLSWLTAW